MLYRTVNKTGDTLSILGYGCMRFPQNNGIIDETRTEKQVISAIEQGVNYFDTAYIYPNSERILGKILAKGYRNRVKIATKLPIPSIQSRQDMDFIFAQQLTRLQTNYIDYYLIHNIVSFSEWNQLKTLGILDFIQEEQQKGRITNIGFSFHGNIQDFKQIVDDYDWDFCQIQYNYIDENYQAGTEGLSYAKEKNLAVIIMEPLRGGTLGLRLPQDAKARFDNFSTKRTPAEWALRWIWNHDAVTTVLSGMNVEEHIAENIAIASDALPNALTHDELSLIEQVRDVFHRKLKVNCTGCSYCMPCPKGVDIPQCFAMYNSHAMLGGITPKMMYLVWTGGQRKSGADMCVSCGICEKRCPQQIEIPKELRAVKKEMHKWYLKPFLGIIKKIMYGKKKN